MPLLTIVIPTFNAASVIEECLKSVLSQDFRDVEIWVMDGGSNDATASIVNRYASLDLRVRWISEPDRGVYDAMNKGMARASGQWLYFMGADDRFYDDAVLSKVAPLLDDNCDLVYGQVWNVDKERLVGEQFDMDTLMNRTICHQALFYRSSFVRSVGDYDLSFKICADWDLNLRCFIRGARAHYFPILICRYAGNGMSAKTVDDVFLTCKLDRVSALMRRPLWSAHFRSSRYELHDLAVAAFKAGKVGAGLRYGCLYAYHGFAAKVTASRSKSGSG